jgi:hypothetical protein
MNRSTSINGVTFSLELGRLSLDEIRSWFAEIAHLSPGSRVMWVARRLRGTPFEFESALPLPPNGCVRFRLETLDCITFIYSVLPFAQATNIEELLWGYYRLRYSRASRIVDNDPAEGTILDFVEESLLTNGIHDGRLKDVTAELDPEIPLQCARCVLGPQRRVPMLDPSELMVSPKYGTREFSWPLMTTADFRRVPVGAILPGDVLLLSNYGYEGNYDVSTVVRHVVLADPGENDLFFYHSTRHYCVRHSPSTLPTERSGRFINGDPTKEQIGVGEGGTFAGDDTKITLGDTFYFGFDQSQPRSLQNFLQFYGGLIVLRPQGVPQ